MNRIFPTILALVLIFGCSKSSSPTPKSNVFMIDYAHESGGVFYHGTFSLVGDKVGATWTTDQGGKKESRSVTMTEATFRSLWDSMNEVEDFKKGTVKDPGQQLDPKTHHVIGIAFRSADGEGMRTHMIPSEGISPAFKEWLGKLGYTGK